MNPRYKTVQGAYQKLVRISRRTTENSQLDIGAIYNAANYIYENSIVDSDSSKDQAETTEKISSYLFRTIDVLQNILFLTNEQIEKKDILIGVNYITKDGEKFQEVYRIPFSEIAEYLDQHRGNLYISNLKDFNTYKEKEDDIEKGGSIELSNIKADMGGITYDELETKLLSILPLIKDAYQLLNSFVYTVTQTVTETGKKKNARKMNTDVKNINVYINNKKKNNKEEDVLLDSFTKLKESLQAFLEDSKVKESKKNNNAFLTVCQSVQNIMEKNDEVIEILKCYKNYYNKNKKDEEEEKAIIEGLSKNIFQSSTLISRAGYLAENVISQNFSQLSKDNINFLMRFEDVNGMQIKFKYDFDAQGYIEVLNVKKQRALLKRFLDRLRNAMVSTNDSRSLMQTKTFTMTKQELIDVVKKAEVNAKNDRAFQNSVFNFFNKKFVDPIKNKKIKKNLP